MTTPMREPLLADPSAPHQLTLEWAWMNRLIEPRCNCGITFRLFHPERLGAVDDAIKAYTAHTAAVAA